MSRRSRDHYIGSSQKMQSYGLRLHNTPSRLNQQYQLQLSLAPGKKQNLDFTFWTHTIHLLTLIWLRELAVYLLLSLWLSANLFICIKLEHRYCFIRWDYKWKLFYAWTMDPAFQMLLISQFCFFSRRLNNDCCLVLLHNKRA